MEENPSLKGFKQEQCEGLRRVRVPLLGVRSNQADTKSSQGTQVGMPLKKGKRSEAITGEEPESGGEVSRARGHRYPAPGGDHPLEKFRE